MTPKQQANIDLLQEHSIKVVVAFALLDNNWWDTEPVKIAKYFDNANLTQHAQALRIAAQEPIDERADETPLGIALDDNPID